MMEEFMKKTIVACFAAGVALTMAVGLTACTPKEEGTYHTVTYVDGNNVLKTEKVKDGEKANKFVPEKDGGYEFVNWYATPSKNHKFDFDQVITQDTTVHAGFTLFKNDTRDYYVVGSGSSELLFISNWGKVITDNHKLTKASTTNEYTITMDLKKGDQFQFVINADWANKRGFGYLASQNLENEEKAFSGEGSVYDDSAKGSNITCEYLGNYTFKLKTYPNEDYYNTSGTGYTEDRKEIYNLGLYDTIEWVRNGDVVNDSITVTDFYIKGASITGWKDMYSPYTKMVNGGNKYTMSIYLKQGDDFMFTSRLTKISDEGEEISQGSAYIKAENLTDASKTFVEGTSGNMKAKASGIYTFTYDNSAKTLAVTFDSEGALTAYDYYLDGNFNGGNYGDFIKKPADFKLVEKTAGSGVYEITGVTLDAGKEFLIRSFKPGDKLDYANKQIDFQFTYLAPNHAFEMAAKDNENIKVKTAGKYDISLDSYSRVITIVPHNENPEDTLDIYIKGTNIGTQVSWGHNFEDQYRFALSADKTAYEYTLTITEGKPVEFGLAKYAKGVNTGDGEWRGVSKLGTAGDANADFRPESGDNFKCNKAGTYKIVYTIATDTLDIYKV